MSVCAILGCDTGVASRGLCSRHYKAARRAGTVAQHPLLAERRNPFTCVCDEPQADPAVNFGECSVCRRKPLSLFGAAS